MITRSTLSLAAMLLVCTATRVSAAPGAATLLSPNGIATGTTIAFSWSAVEGANWYQFWLGTQSPSALVQSQWYTAEQAGCANGGTCTIMLTPQLVPGGYVWFVQTWGGGASGPWSAGLAFGMRDVASWSRTVPHHQRFTLVLNNEAVLDSETGLTWQRTPSASAGGWLGELNLCFSTQAGGRRGWRLPTIHELASLAVDGNPNSLAPGHPFVLGENPSFWSETPYGLGTNILAGYFDGSSFFMAQAPQANSYRAWCVRGPTGANH